MNSPKIKAAIESVRKQLSLMTAEEIRALDASLPKGPFFNLLLNSGFIEANGGQGRSAKEEDMSNQ